MLRTSMDRSSFAFVVCCALLACTVDEGPEARTLDCDRAPTNDSGRALCRRFEAHLELVGGHGMSAARRHWGCSDETFRKLWCAGAPNRDELQALSASGYVHSGEHKHAISVTLLGCSEGMLLFMRSMEKPKSERHPFYANIRCDEHDQPPPRRAAR